MKALNRHDGLYRCFNLQYRNFSATSIAELDTTFQEALVAVATNPSPTHAYNLQNLLQQCARQRASMEGKACHGQIIHYGLQPDTLTSNMLINMYSKCELVDSARKVFDEMTSRSPLSWNTMISAYTQNGSEEDALNLFVKMQREGTEFSEFTISSILCSCAAKFAIFDSKQLHGFALKTAIFLNVFVSTALLDVYAKCDLITDAFRVFECMPERSAVTWSSMMAGYVQNELYEEAIALFHRARKMGLDHMIHNQFAISSVLSACAAMAALIEGKQLHAIVYKTSFRQNSFVASSLLDMYAKCGSIKEAYLVFVGSEEKNLVLWNAIISGFSKHALCTEVMISFEKMQQMGKKPDEFTYVSVLSACAHMGLVERGRKYFYVIMKEHNILPNVVHYSCMVDVIGRKGLLQEAKELIDKMPFDPTAPMWGSLLASCKIHGNVELAEIAAKQLFELEPSNAGNHVLLSNTYAVNKKWVEVALARKRLKEREAKKEIGKSWIAIKDKVHSFMAGERVHPRIGEIYLKLEDFMAEMKEKGYGGDAKHELHDLEEDEKQELLRQHSEKLAFVFGDMCLPSGVPVRIMKNLRICGDCHLFMKFASSITGRDIVVRDTNRFHHFRSGFCSCGEFW